MNDVLAKPFTKDGMIRILKKHLPYLLKNPPAADGDELMGGGGGGALHAPQPVSTPGYAAPPPLSMGGTMGPAASVKYETTPIQSPATTSSWHSPGGPMAQHAQASPHLDGGAFMAGGPPPRPAFPGAVAAAPQMSNPPIRSLPEALAAGDDRPGKRQRVYVPPGQFAQ